MSTEAELVPNMPRAHYDAQPRMNWSRIKHLRRSPAHFRHAMTARQADSDPRRLGRATHLAVFEPMRFPFECVEWTGKVRNGNAWDKFRATNEGREILTSAQMDFALAIGDAARKDSTAAKYLEGGPAELTVLWTHHFPAEVEQCPQCAPGPGALRLEPIDMKARIDFVSSAGGGALVDLKTTRDASPDGFGRQIWSLRYHTQAAVYQDGYFEATGKRLPFVLVAVETEPPHVVQVYRVPEIGLEAGRDEYRTLLGRLALCRAESKWPGYGEGEMEAEFPKWSGLAADDEDLSDIGVDFPEG